jgi:hypothetical protein
MYHLLHNELSLKTDDTSYRLNVCNANSMPPFANKKGKPYGFPSQSRYFKTRSRSLRTMNEAQEE